LSIRSTADAGSSDAELFCPRSLLEGFHPAITVLFGVPPGHGANPNSDIAHSFRTVLAIWLMFSALGAR
jgi:hypothetical protein